MLTKTAVAKIIANVSPKKTGSAKLGEFQFDAREGYLYVSARAVSATVNSNLDAFSAEELERAWQTFINKPVFVEHESQDIKRARGVIIDAMFHDEDPEDVWVEILMEMDEKTFPILCSYIRSGELDTMSMGCNLAYSTCSICGNEAITELDYCDHIISKGSYYYIDGQLKQSYENCCGVEFYEESWVYVPASKDCVTYSLIDEDNQVEKRAKEAQTTVMTISEETIDTCPICDSASWDGHYCPVCGHTEEQEEKEARKTAKRQWCETKMPVNGSYDVGVYPSVFYSNGSFDKTGEYEVRFTDHSNNEIAKCPQRFASVEDAFEHYDDIIADFYKVIVPQISITTRY